MYARQYEWYIKHLSEHVRMKPSNVLYVKSVATWCREHGMPETDDRKPVKLIPGNGSGGHMLIAEEISDDFIDEHIARMKRRVGDRIEAIDSGTKKIAYLFLKEFSSSFPDLVFDETASDEWVLEQMDRISMLPP